MMLLTHINIIFFNLEGKLIPLIVCLNLSYLLFVIGLVGIVWNKKSFLIMLICMELMFFAVALNFTFISIFSQSVLGQTFSLFIVTAAASETAIGLSLLIISFRLGNKVSYSSLTTLRG